MSGYGRSAHLFPFTALSGWSSAPTHPIHRYIAPESPPPEKYTLTPLITQIPSSGGRPTARGPPSQRQPGTPEIEIIQRGSMACLYPGSSSPASGIRLQAVRYIFTLQGGAALLDGGRGHGPFYGCRCWLIPLFAAWFDDPSPQSAEFQEYSFIIMSGIVSFGSFIPCGRPTRLKQCASLTPRNHGSVPAPASFDRYSHNLASCFSANYTIL